MALIVEDGSGKVDAESYGSVAGALVYFGNAGVSSVEGAAFVAASTTRQEQALRAATQFLDSKYVGVWNGRRLTGTQRLDWPRTGVDFDGFTQPASPLPRHLIEATYEAAARDVVGGSQALQPDQTAEQQIVSKSVSVGGAVSKSVTYAAGERSASAFFTKIEALIGRLLVPARLVRM